MQEEFSKLTPEERGLAEEHFRHYNKKILSSVELRNEMDKGMKVALLDLGHCTPDRNIMPMIVVFIRDCDGDICEEFYAMAVTEDNADESYRNIGTKIRMENKFVAGLMHWSEVWIAHAKHSDMPIRPSEHPNRREGVVVSAVTMLGGIMTLEQPFTRNAEGKAVWDTADQRDDHTNMILPSHFRHFLSGYIKAGPPTSIKDVIEEARKLRNQHNEDERETDD